MAITSADLQAFHCFAQAKLEIGEAETLQDLLNDWEVESRSPTEQQEDLAAVKGALEDMNRGDTGRPAEAISDELRAELARRQ